MRPLTIRNLEPALIEQLQARAARNGRSVEAELRHILSVALSDEKNRKANLAEMIRLRFLPLGGIDQFEPHPPVHIGDPPAP